MFLTKKKRREIAKDLAYVSVALISQIEMEACLFSRCQEKLTNIADKIGGIEMVSDVITFSDILQKQLKEKINNQKTV